ncbi:MAG: ferritin-like domain-containing protein [Chloroflexi bacterium]|uniref:Ferritin-like domain-containing protein n=1 Tax=Candidatus Chlorohelix allophototropha TaxID=3003348 RepID=A0A8T7M799_9CHLR|nr:ferritin-like domain-containing protein [Chloroflexota bacterium]WJW69903.1 ferritin-like domain-containing protein [Chloroflexota bacterium L227-S17]
MWQERLGYLQDVYRITGRRFGYFVANVANGSLTNRLNAPSSSSALWNLEYEPDFAKGRKLYDLAKLKGWNPETDIEWDKITSSDQPLMRDEYWGAASMGLTEVLTEEETLELNRYDLGWIISQLMHGEQGSLLICAQLVDMRPDMDGKLFLASQVMDEARHTEVFRHYLDSLKVVPPDVNIKFIIDSLLGTANWYKKAIGMLILIEGYAMGVFSYVKRATLDPCLLQILDFVMQDEGRHVGFGIESIAEEVRDMLVDERQELEDYAYSLCRTLFFGRERGGFRSQLNKYWEMSQGRTGLTRAEFEHKVYNSSAMIEFQHDTFYNHLATNLDRTGLFSERVKPKYRELGLPV